MLEAFSDISFRGDSEQTIATANAILDEYKRQGFVLTLRQLYYQFVARGLRPNTERSYKSLGKLVTKARMAGLMDWEAIEDRNRSVSRWLIEPNTLKILRDLPKQFALDMWKNQDFYVEVWVEKDALSNVVERACQKRRVPFLACKGYLSASEAYRAAKRFERKGLEGKQCVVVHLGDHDPSGLDMTRDNSARLNLMSMEGVHVHRIALNRDQIDQYDPPPNPTKITDSRAQGYLDEHGETSWELDALEPSVIAELIDDAIEPMVNEGVWDEDLREEYDRKDLLRGVAEHWDEIETLIRSNSEED